MTHGDLAAGLIGEAAGTPLPERWQRHEVPGGSVTRLRRVKPAGWQVGSTRAFGARGACR